MYQNIPPLPNGPMHSEKEYLVHLTSYGYRRETARAQSEIVGTLHGHRMGSLRFPLKVCEDPTISLRSPHGSDSEHTKIVR